MNFALDLLNDQQRTAVLHTEGPCMVIAGPGAGKTRVLTTRIAYLMEAKKIQPASVLALTFTNKAADEMKNRITNMVGPAGKSVWLGTFHSCFARILRIEAERLGYPRNFSIYDTTDSKSLLKNIIQDMGLDDKTYTPNVVLNRISSAKNRLITPQAYCSNPFYQQEDKDVRKPQVGEIYSTYAKRCLQAGAMDFDDILLNMYLLSIHQPEEFAKYQQQFQYILIDEFQDTNVAQYTIITALAALHHNLCIVGDDGQSIYSFRGATIRNILNFEQDYPQLQIIKLEQNYRSTQKIVEVANSVISNNQEQLKKHIWTNNEHGESIGLIRAMTDSEESRLVASSIFEHRMKAQLRNDDFAILYRTNSQSRSIEEALRNINIPYRMLGGMSFYQRKEVKDMMAYLRLIVNHNDEEALKRIINEPKRGIGASNIDKLLIIANEEGITLWEAIQNVHHFLKSRVSDAIAAFAGMIETITASLDTKNAYEIATEIAQQSGLLRTLHEDKTVEGLARYENLQELLNAIKAFTVNDEEGDASLGHFLQNIALTTDTESEEDKAVDRVSLMTIHAAKGLEFKYVYIMGIEEELFPSPMMSGSKEELEEERRLFYVALTRAEKRVFLSYSNSRYRFGKLKQCEASRFLKEINPVYLQQSYHPSSNTAQPTSNRHTTRQFINSMKPVSQQKATSINDLSQHRALSAFATSEVNDITVDMQVEHPIFGMGKVLHIEKSGPHRKARINFIKTGEKTLLLNFAKLRITDQVVE